VQDDSLKYKIREVTNMINYFQKTLIKINGELNNFNSIKDSITNNEIITPKKFGEITSFLSVGANI